MSFNNSPTNRSIRRAAALERFKISPTGSLRTKRTPDQKAEADTGYVERKEIERAAHTRVSYA